MKEPTKAPRAEAVKSRPNPTSDSFISEAGPTANSTRDREGRAGGEVEHPGHHRECAEDLLVPEEPQALTISNAASSSAPARSGKSRDQEQAADGRKPQCRRHGKARHDRGGHSRPPSGGPANWLAVSSTA